MIGAVWLLSLPLRLLAALGLRRSVILACLFVLAVTAYGVAEDLGVLDPPARAAPARKPAAGQPRPSRAAVADIPSGYLRLYNSAGARYGHGRPHDPANAIPAAARYLVDHGARRNLDRAIYAYNHSRSYVAKVKELAHGYATRRGGRQ